MDSTVARVVLVVIVACVLLAALETAAEMWGGFPWP